MALPWKLAFRAIPWAAILANAPAVAESARRLLADTQPRRGAATSGVAALAERVTALEQRDRETAELVAQLTAQNAALTAVIEVLQARVRALLVIAIVAAIVAIAGLIVALVR